MVLAIAILVSLVISLGISIYFYKINLENNKSTQVKRLADKKIEDINENYSKIVNQYNLLVSDFKAQQSQANSMLLKCSVICFLSVIILITFLF